MEIPRMMSIDELRRKRREEADPSVSERSLRARSEVADEYKKDAECRGSQKKEQLCIKGISGTYADAVFPLDYTITIGRQRGEANILYPENSLGISRKHCRIWVDDDGTVRLKDMGASQGTYFFDGTKLMPEKVYRLRVGETFYLASPKEAYKVVTKEMTHGN